VVAVVKGVEEDAVAASAWSLDPGPEGPSQEGQNTSLAGIIGIGPGLCDLRRIDRPGTGVKIDSAATHFHGFGVAQQGPWATWVNKRLLVGGRRSYQPLARSVRRTAGSTGSTCARCAPT
jgi:hypothetical protein